MCTAIFENKHGVFFGRTLDLECSFGEKVARLSAGEIYPYIHMGKIECRYSLLGMSIAAEKQLLFYDAVNEKGLSAAALNFPGFAVYHKREKEEIALASFEVIPYLLSECASVSEAISVLERATITPDDFSESFKSTPLHWMIADREHAIVLESVADGLKIYENPIGVMTNSPPFPYQTLRLCDYMSLTPRQPENNVLPSQNITPYSRGLGAQGLPGDFSSSSRFIRAAFVKEHTLMPQCSDKSFDQKSLQRRIFDILGTLSLPYGIARTEKGEPIYTVYTSCIDMERCEYSFFTFENREIKTFKF